MSKTYKTATVFGGTGFVGTQVVRELASRGVIVKVASRIPERAYFLRPCGAVGQIVPFGCDYSDDDSLRAAIQGSDYVVNCIGILYEKGKKRTFKNIHTELPRRIAEICKEQHVSRFVHISALGIEKCTSKYAKSKLAGEKAIQQVYPNATILRPSVIFGEDDNFFNMFAKMAGVLPVLPLIGGGKTKFQPVFVGDVADAVMAGLEKPAVGDKNPQGKIYELGGPEVVSFKEIYERLFSYIQHAPALMNLPFGLAKIQAGFMSIMPEPLLTPDQVESLKHDTIVSENALTLEDLGIEETAMASILPTYLTRYRPGGRFGNDKIAV